MCKIIIIIFPSYLKCVYDITIDLIWLCSYLTGYMTLSPWLYRTVYPWYRCDSLYSLIFSLSNIECILTRTRVWGFALNSIPYGIFIGADTVHSALFQVKSPWTSDRGHAPIHYDAHRISLIERQIENIKSSNATMCQLEYTATKGGPGGQARN